MTGPDICEVCTQEVCATPVQLFPRFQLPRTVPRSPGAQTLSHAHQFDLEFKARTFDRQNQRSFLFLARFVHRNDDFHSSETCVWPMQLFPSSHSPGYLSSPPHTLCPPSTLYTFCQYFQIYRKTLSVGTACWNLDRKLLLQFEYKRIHLEDMSKSGIFNNIRLLVEKGK